MIVEEWCRRAAKVAPEARAIECGELRCSWSELLDAAEAGAKELLSRGVCAGDLVAIELPPSIDFAQALHAIWMLGAIAMPLDVRMTEGERDGLCENVTIRIKEPLAPAPWHSVSDTSTPPWHPVSDTSTPPWHPVSDASTPPWHPVSDTSASPAAAADASTDAKQGVRPTAGHHLHAVAVVLHTSGTTSKPKRVELTFGNFLYSALGSAVALGSHPRERWLCTLPVCHVGGLSILIRSAIFATTAVVHPRFDTDRALTAIMREQITIVSVVATTLSRLLDAGLKDPPALRLALAGGGPVPAALLQRAAQAGVPVSQTYGLTESCSQASTVPLAALEGLAAHVVPPAALEGLAAAPAPLEGAADGGVASLGAGRPLFCTKVEIGEDGEILLSGPTIAKGALSPDGRLHTGDVGVIDQEGNLHVTGRIADTIVSGGENVAPAEVEGVIEAHPHVLEAAVVGRPHQEWGEAVTAIVVLRPGAELTLSELREHCASSLASFKVPKDLVLASGPLPRTRSGKLLRRELQGRYDGERRELDARDERQMREARFR